MAKQWKKSNEKATSREIQIVADIYAKDTSGCSIVGVSSLFSKPNKKEFKTMDKLRREYLKSGGTIKDYGSSMDTYKEKKRLKKC
jgi:hypothetical protein